MDGIRRANDWTWPNVSEEMVLGWLVRGVGDVVAAVLMVAFPSAIKASDGATGWHIRSNQFSETRCKRVRGIDASTGTPRLASTSIAVPNDSSNNSDR